MSNMAADRVRDVVVKKQEISEAQLFETVGLFFGNARKTEFRSAVLVTISSR